MSINMYKNYLSFDPDLFRPFRMYQPLHQTSSNISVENAVAMAPLPWAVVRVEAWTSTAGQMWIPGITRVYYSNSV